MINKGACPTCFDSFVNNCVGDFLKRLIFLQDVLHNVSRSIYKGPSETITSQETERKNFREVKDCWFCDIAFYEKEGFIGEVRNPCHITGKNCTATHTHSNLNVKQNSASFMPVLLNIMTNDDYH